MQNDLSADGWRFEPCEGFIEHVGGLWRREVESARQFAFIGVDCHMNRNGVVHGGMLMTFADRAFGFTAREAADALRSATVSLSHQFAAPMPIGAVATIEPRITRLTGQMAFLSGTVMADGVPVLEAHGVWKIWRG
ncbi:PaaI family thioesterase [Roseivivax marinus]|uniref:PaaI family thioesterase n=1 Tax=Roseivivax marinus TaxID=1379903 RepID=UPI001F04559B|nr:PaaI family thioesterase [Roseivivax marinus]UMA64918.1 PaaI family thioesterase [Roseivivax marinus]